MRKRIGLVLFLVLTLVATACGDSDEGDSGSGSCDVADLNLVTPDVLTIATGEPAFFPYVIDDTPTNKQGFESAVAYAVANEMGFTDDQVTWVRTGFDEAVTVGPKTFDFNLQQYSITDVRDQVVDFSSGYYEVKQSLVAKAGSAADGATSVADLKGLRLGAQIGTTSLDLIESVIEPDSEAAVYNDNTAVQAALNADQIDAFVVDLPTGLFIANVEMDDGVVVGQFETQGDAPEEYGLLFAEGNSLVPCVNDALNALEADGRLAAIEQQWLVEGTDVPIFSQ